MTARLKRLDFVKLWKAFKRWFCISLGILVIGPFLVILSLRWVDPITSSFMLQHDIRSFFSKEVQFSEYEWKNWDDISISFPLAVVASEDQRFPSHFGLDITELKKALSDKTGKRRGASTITQQVAKNLFLWSGRSYVRKAMEAGLAVSMEVLLSKRRILEIYVNIAQLGESTYGIGKASERFFDKPANQINRYEAARLAAVLPNPVRLSVNNTSSYVLSRQKWILKQMQQLGGNQYVDSL